MKRLNLFPGFFLLFLVSGCFAPLNSLYDNAELLEKNEIRINASYSKYYGSTYSWDEGFSEGLDNLNDNFGLSIGYGFSEKFNLNFRYEYLKTKSNFEIFNDEYNFGKVNYFEAGSKFNLKKDRMALGIPLGVYFSEEVFLWSVDPRLFVTFRKSDKFEVNLIPKVHLFIGDGASLVPGISIGLGFSENLDKWAIRPEIGIDGNVYFGIGVNINSKKK